MISIVGIACRYPDADDPQELWMNVLAGRRAFRRIPDERMRLADYWSADPAAPDRFYSPNAALIEGFDFDRVGFKIAGSTYRVTDMTHWLALDTAARALADAGFADGEGLPKQSTAVVIGNSLTGEFTRANLMRLRWPYVRRVVGAALYEQGWDASAVAEFMRTLEARYKSPFPPIDEDTLAGGLSNTIAGRICNQFDFKGGGFTVDGACSSSLLAVAQACTALHIGQVDAAIAGGVDLSIDPFEVIGFAKTGALASSDMRVYDKNSNGFWPGEGCGMFVLVRQEDAAELGLRSYATIAGWGVASDGRGGMTRPEAEGHRLAVRRAYKLAEFDISTVSYLEGHGTGTAVGDETELRALAGARRDACPAAPPAAISTVKGNIGHTKAAAGAAGLVKATLAVFHQVIPPATGHHDAHPELEGPAPALRVPTTAELWPADLPVRAGISAMGFGGIDAHVVIESAGGTRCTNLDSSTSQLVRSRQDCELLLVDADSLAELRDRVAGLAAFASRLSYAELADLAATLQGELASRPARAAFVASSPLQAEQRFAAMLTMLDSGRAAVVDAASGLFLGTGATQPRVGYMFPGQGSGKRADGGAIARRFEPVQELYRTLVTPAGGDLVDTSAAQPRIVAASVAGLRALSLLGIDAIAAVGHSLGELTSLHWAGGMSEPELMRIAAMRGQVMARASDGGGAMMSIATGPEQVERLLGGTPVVIAGYNGPHQTVVSGPAAAVERVRELASGQGLTTVRIAVSHAFHSPAVASAAGEFGAYLGEQAFRPLSRRVVSTVTSDTLPADTDVRDLLVRQVLEPVRFGEALQQVAAEVDLLLEVGPGRVLSALAADIAPEIPAVSLETDSVSLAGTLSAAAAAFVLGSPVRVDRLFCDRFTKPLPLNKEFRFFVSPCEQAPADDSLAQAASDAAATADASSSAAGDQASAPARSLDLLRQLTARRAELPLEAVRADSLLLDELHFSSITVGQIVNQAARELGVSAPLTTASLATATLADLAQMLDDLTATALPGDASGHQPAGVAPWVRAFSNELVVQAAGARTEAVEAGKWTVFASAGHPLSDHLGRALELAMLGDGVLLCLPDDCDERDLGLMLDAARAALGSSGHCRFVVVSGRLGAAGLAKTLHLEAPAIATSVICLPIPGQPSEQAIIDIVDRIVADVAATSRFSEVHYDDVGTRTVPVLRPLAAEAGDNEPPLGASDVILVTGGGKGITAECALALGARTGAAIALLGRSDPGADADLAANLSRMDAAGVTYCYVRADVTSHFEVKAAVQRVSSTLGPVTAVLHGAGRNEPVPLSQLTEEVFLQTLAPKITGLESVLAAVDPAELRLLVTFGSIIGRAGLRGQADYATANAWLTELTCRIQERNPQCRCLALEWSVWAGAGMGERLGVLESLAREGISAISVDEGVSMLLQLISRPDLPTAVVVMGRVGDLPTITLEQRELPLARFIDRPLVYYPGVELVADTELSADSDPYLLDHLLDGEMLFPAVFGVEAMTQAAATLVDQVARPVLHDVEFIRPIVVPHGGSVTIRVAALSRAGAVEAVVRSSETSFQADHFRATLRWGCDAPVDAAMPDQATPELPAVPLDPALDLYGGVLFQGRRFQRVLAYRSMAATSCVAEISTVPGERWFGAYLPTELSLGDPGARDAFMHAIQCCVPTATLLPAAVDRIYPGVVDAGTKRVVLAASERDHDGDSYTYDLDVRDTQGRLVERWEGLRLQAVRKQDGSGPWVAALLGPYLERQLAGMRLQAPRCVVEPDGSKRALGRDARRRQTRLALGRLLGHPVVVRYRGDGKPEVDEDVSISVSHNAGLTLAVALAGQIGCDLQLVADRTVQDWRLLLGDEQLTLAQLIALERTEDFPVAATRVWGAVECLRKIGRAVVGSVTLDDSGPDNWVLLRAGDAQITSFATHLRDEAAPVVLTILMEGGSESGSLLRIPAHR